MSAQCWICDAKAELKNEKLKAARLEAQTKAINEQKTIAIWKEGPFFKTGEPAQAYPNAIIDYVSHHTEAAVE